VCNICHHGSNGVYASSRGWAALYFSKKEWRRTFHNSLFKTLNKHDNFSISITAAIPIVLIVLATVFHSASKFWGLGP